MVFFKKSDEIFLSLSSCFQSNLTVKKHSFSRFIPNVNTFQIKIQDLGLEETKGSSLTTVNQLVRVSSTGVTNGVTS